MDTKNWYSVGIEGSAVSCAVCHREIEHYPQVDHHPFWCPYCGVESLIFLWKQTIIQIIPRLAPLALQKTIKWLQTNLDEIEFIELVVSLEEIADNKE